MGRKKNEESKQKKSKQFTDIPFSIQICIEDKWKTVKTADYVTAKTLSLQDFGYEALTEDGLKEQLLKVLNGEELNVIGMFMDREVKPVA